LQLRYEFQVQKFVTDVAAPVRRCSTVDEPSVQFAQVESKVPAAEGLGDPVHTSYKAFE